MFGLELYNIFYFWHLFINQKITLFALQKSVTPFTQTFPAVFALFAIRLTGYEHPVAEQILVHL